jgi:hypothetical protein
MQCAIVVKEMTSPVAKDVCVIRVVCVCVSYWQSFARRRSVWNGCRVSTSRVAPHLIGSYYSSPRRCRHHHIIPSHAVKSVHHRPLTSVNHGQVVPESVQFLRSSTEERSPGVGINFGYFDASVKRRRRCGGRNHRRRRRSSAVLVLPAPASITLTATSIVSANAFYL